MAKSLCILGVIVFSSIAVLAAPPATDQQQGILDKLTPSLVRVEYHLQFDKGEPPKAMGWRQRCPNCGQYHDDNRGAEFVTEQRPLEMGGFVLSPTRVIVPDPIVHPRFVKNIMVLFGGQAVSAQPVLYAANQKALILDLAEKLQDAKTLNFNPSKKGPYLTVTYGRFNGQWTKAMQSLSMAVTRPEFGQPFTAAPSHCLIVDKNGTPVGMSLSDELPLDNSWKGSPLDWPMLSAGDMAGRLAELQKRADAGLLRVTLNFRSPKAKEGMMGMRMGRRGEEGENATEQNAVGVLLNDKAVLVIANLKPNVTARLEKIIVHTAADEAIPAKFKASLSDYGCLVAEPEKPLSAPLAWSDRNIVDYRNQLLLTAEIVIQGEKRLGYYQHQRFPSFRVGWKQHIYPEIPGEDRNLFFFDTQGNLLAVPVARREKVSEQERYEQSEPLLTSVHYLKETLGDLAQSADASNVPLTEQQENRLAWFGVELQGLNQDLARVNNVSDLTHDGETGALVSYVYPDSPAAQAGVEVGFVLVRLHVEGMPKPLDVKVEEHPFGDEPFPWEQLDKIPEQYLDRIPQPWPSAENAFTRALTDVGFGKKFAAEFFKDGKSITKEFEVVESPAHYDSALRYKSEALGLTLRDLTYEVRHYYQKPADDPGVIVSKIERGGKASVAGVKPYEIITHVNDQPVSTVADFEKLILNQEELRLSVKRMTRGRVVKIRMTPTAAPSENPPPASQEGGATFGPQIN